MLLSNPSCVCGPRLYSSWRTVYTDPQHVFKLGYLSFYFKLSEEFYALGTNPLSDTSFAQFLFPLCVCLFIFLMVYFETQKLLRCYLGTVPFISVTQSSPTVCDPMDYSTPGFPVHHQLPELTQIHVDQVSDAIQTILSSVVPFSSCLQSFPASGYFPRTQLLTLGGQSIGVSASGSVLPMNIQD